MPPQLRLDDPAIRLQTEEPPRCANQAEIDAIAQREYKKNVADAGLLLQLAGQLKTDIEGRGTQTVSATTVKEAEQIEKLAHGIRNRLKH